METILIVDDDQYINDLLVEALKKERYNVVQAFSGSEALMILERTVPDLILLDLMLPGMSGEDVIKKISNIPTIVISAKVDIDSKVNLLSTGAADYVVKPFDIRELIARIKLQLKNAKKLEAINSLSYDDLILDTSSHSVTVSGNDIKLTRTEFSILKLLLLNKGSVVTKSTILDRVCLEAPDLVESSLKVHISNIRKKLREYSDKEYIENIWGIGFKLG